MIPVRVPAAAVPHVMPGVRPPVQPGHPLAMDQCPVCDGPLTAAPLALVFVGIAPEDRKPSGFTTGAAVAAHAVCVGLDPEETP